MENIFKKTNTPSNQQLMKQYGKPFFTQILIFILIWKKNNIEENSMDFRN
ncbi:hypothetical protein L950_0229350 [Sphingobacterium sp. IITKGP-BTPF85]|nr:hypothetical protein L950_0229350 [Sphingobacterium sp. IITKGP-BTPF85]